MRVLVGEGVALHVTTWEGGDGVPFLLVHGLASNCRTWDGVAARLHDVGHPVAAVDLRGHGQSDKPDTGYDFATLCGDLIEVLGGIGFARAVVAGQSTGGNIAVELAAHRPELLVGVAGVDGGSLELSHQFPNWEDCAAALAPPRLAGTPEASVRDWIRGAHPEWGDWAVEATMANFEVLADGTIRPWLSFDRHLLILRSLWEHRPSEVVPELSVPLLLALADTGDSWMAEKRAMADELVAAAPAAPGGVRVEWFSPGDHDLHLQFPVELADLLHAAF